MTGHRALNRLAALPNFKDIEGADREEVCELFDSLQTVHAAIADAAGSLASLCHDWQYHVWLTSLRNKTERKVDSLNIYCENTLSQQRTHEELFTFNIYSIPQNQVICST